jgi:hypothetical protein
MAYELITSGKTNKPANTNVGHIPKSNKNKTQKH